LKILRAEFVTSAAADASGVPRDGFAQIALAGRSNVGKSTLINALCRKKIARTSAAPGKTRLANVYRVDVDTAGTHSLYLVDLPGYGYARGGEQGAKELADVAEAYFAARRSSAERRAPGTGAVLLLVDARHPGLESDLQAAGWLATLDVTAHVVATKVDKLSRAERVRNLREMARTFATSPLAVSATTGEGIEDLWKLIVRLARSRDRTKEER
jgi:GTP-binding protein